MFNTYQVKEFNQTDYIEVLLDGKKVVILADNDMIKKLNLLLEANSIKVVEQ